MLEVGVVLDHAPELTADGHTAQLQTMGIPIVGGCCGGGAGFENEEEHLTHTATTYSASMPPPPANTLTETATRHHPPEKEKQQVSRTTATAYTFITRLTRAFVSMSPPSTRILALRCRTDVTYDPAKAVDAVTGCRA